MTFDFPLRVRCVEGNSFFHRGDDYTALRMLGADICVIDGNPGELIARSARFKPIVRRRAVGVCA